MSELFSHSNGIVCGGTINYDVVDAFPSLVSNTVERTPNHIFSVIRTSYYAEAYRVQLYILIYTLKSNLQSYKILLN